MSDERENTPKPDFANAYQNTERAGSDFLKAPDLPARGCEVSVVGTDVRPSYGDKGRAGGFDIYLQVQSAKIAENAPKWLRVSPSNMALLDEAEIKADQIVGSTLYLRVASKAGLSDWIQIAEVNGREVGKKA